VFTWQFALYTLGLGFICVLLIPLTNLWWIVPLLGVAAPIVLALGQARSGEASRSSVDAGLKRDEILEAVTDRGELTPAEAAQWTSSTVVEATGLLESLAQEGRLTRLTRDGGVVYAIPASEPDPAVEREAALAETETSGPRATAHAAEPLSEREREVLAALASGKTTAEAARDLFISIGTVKSHTANIYRKLNVKNRAEAITRARDLGLLP
jgi:DNA-binding CsgD family transcriptional regulator